MTLRDRIQAVAERLRGVPGTLGMRPWTVSVRRREWSGERVGVGVPTDFDTPLSVQFGRSNPRVQEISNRDVVASGGAFSSGDIKVGPLTPSCLASVSSALGGHSPADLDPDVSVRPSEVLFFVTGPGTDAAGTWYRRVESSGFKLFHHTLILRATKARI